MKSLLPDPRGARRRVWLSRCALAAAGMLAMNLPALATAAGAPDAANVSNAPNAGNVHIDNFTFSPATLTVKAGTRVTWTNRDDEPHTVTSSGNPRAFASGALDTDGSFAFTFDKPGTYPYYCAIHPHMTGVIVVK